MKSRETTPARRPKILFASGEQRVLNSIRLMFGRRFELFLVSTTPTALDVLEQHDIEVIVCDHHMPELNGIDALAAMRTVATRAARILLVDDTALDSIEAPVDDLGTFRLLTKPYVPDELRAAIDLAVTVARRDAAIGPAPPVDPEQQLAHDILCREPPELPPSPAAEILDDWNRTMTEQELAETDVIEASEVAEVMPLEEHHGDGDPAAVPEDGVVVFSLDESVIDSIREAARDRFSVYAASNIVHVVKILKERCPGVLVTDIALDRSSVRSMTAQLRQHVPQLVTIIASEHRDSADFVWLVNHGEVFRFLSKPASPGRCAVSIRAALQYHATLRELARQAAGAEERSGDTSAVSGVFEKLRSVSRLWA